MSRTTRIIIISCLFSAFATSACTRLTNKQAEDTPAMAPLITVADISVNGKKAPCDTIYLGDTIQISVALDPFYNTITNFDVEIDPKEFTDSIFSKYDFETYCDTLLSDKENGHFKFKGMEPFLGVFIPRMQFVPKKLSRKGKKPFRIAVCLTTDVDSTAQPNPCVKEFSVVVIKRPDIEHETVDEKIDRLIDEEYKKMSK